MTEFNSEVLLVTNLLKKSIDKKKVGLKKIEKLERLTGDASTRRYYRVYDGTNSFVVCLDKPFSNEQDSEFVSIQKIYLENGISVPFIYDVSPENGYILEQDLGDSTLLSKLAETNSTVDELTLYQSVLDDLIKIHKIKIEDYSSSSFTKRSFDYNKLLGELEFTYKFMFKKFLNTNYTKNEESTLFSFFEKISSELSKGSKVVCHRDFHSRNIMMKDSKHYIIDFQDSMLGIPQYDLVSLLEDCYYQVSQNNKIKLLRYYWKLTNTYSNIDQSYENFEYYYNIMAIQRTLKAIGSFCYIYYLREDIRYLKYIGFGFEKVRTFLNLFDDFHDAKNLMGKSYYES